MKGLRSTVTVSIVVAAILLLAAAGCMLQAGEQHKPHTTLFIGVDASQSFKHSGYYDNAVTFLAHYIYGHLNGLGGLDKPTQMFIGSVGGRSLNEPKSFQPIHSFQGKSIAQIEADLRKLFTPNDTYTEFNPFFQEVARITKERNLVLAPITLMLVTDGIPDSNMPGVRGGAQVLYEKINLDPLEYLSRNITLRIIYLSPKVAQQWRTHIPRKRIRLLAVDGEVMRGWKSQIRPGASIEEQERFWKWVREIVDFRVRSIRF